ncbi:MAG: DUF488 domain-containing protein [Bdellovibrionales bacterium]|nr:DUF488 domain-containing protein [Bdellovibrionales bacterium]
MKSIKIFTIGFTKKTADVFFEKLKQSGAKRIVDVRLNNVSQLAGFAKKNDLIYFLKEISDMDYVHLPDMAPTKDILNEYKKNKGDWNTYEYKFMKLMKQRCIEKQDIKNIIHQGCLLCSEHEPDHCHRRLIIEYLKKKWTDETLQIIHL